MRDLVLYIATSLDGFIARADGAVDWLTPDQEFSNEDYGYQKFLQTIDTILMGRKTYDQLLEFGPFPYENKQCYVFTRDEAKTEDEHVQFVHENINNFVKMLKLGKGLNIWLVGGGAIINEIMPHNLIDKYIISILPILLGSGIPLFQPKSYEVRLKLDNQISFQSGLVQLHYSRIHATDG